MTNKLKAWVVVSVLGVSGLAVMVRHGHADEVDDGAGPEFFVGANVHGDGYEVKQRIVGDEEGPVTIVTKLSISTAIPPGPPNLNGAVPPGPPNVEKLTVRVTVPSHGQAHAAGLLLAVGVAEGLPLQQVAAVFAQLNWSVKFTIKGQVTPIGAAHAGTLSNLIAAGLLVSDRPGGGCDGALGFFQTAANLLGLPASCGAVVGPNGN
jgi:hypothetical protein